MRLLTRLPLGLLAMVIALSASASTASAFNLGNIDRAEATTTANGNTGISATRRIQDHGWVLTFSHHKHRRYPQTLRDPMGKRPYVVIGKRPYVVTGKRPYVVTGKRPYVVTGKRPYVVIGRATLTVITRPD